MATAGKSAHLEVASNDVSPYVMSVTFEQDNDVLDITCYGATGHAFLASLTDGKVTIEGLWDKTATVGSHTVFQALVGDSNGDAFIWGPEGSASGSVKHSFTGILESYSESAPVADLVKFTASVKISGAVTTGTFA